MTDQRTDSPQHNHQMQQQEHQMQQQDRPTRQQAQQSPEGNPDAPAWLDGEGLHLADDQLKRKISNKPVSASTISGLIDGCPAKFTFTSLLADTVIPKTPDDPRVRGTIFHRACELYYNIAPQERGEHIDFERFEECKLQALDENPDMKDDPGLRAWLESASQRFCSMGPDSTDVTVARYRTDNGTERPATEMKISLHLDGVRRRVFGAIDRLVAASPDDPRTVIVDDFKTGRKASVYSEHMRFADFSYLRQQTLYAMLLEHDTRTFENGWNPIGGRLLFPLAEQVTVHDEGSGRDMQLPMKNGALICLDVKDESHRKRTLEEAALTSDMLDHEYETNLYEYRPSNLCAWCPLARICPAARISDRENAQQAAAGQPDAATLAPAIVCA